jgi:NADPH-dependent ferric siderophore reductase
VAAHTCREPKRPGPRRLGLYIQSNAQRLFRPHGPRHAASLRKRTYSVWGYDVAAGRLELAGCTLSDGPDAHWAAACRPGDVVHFYRPSGKFVLDPTAPAYALLGDISCLAHFYKLRR